MYTSKTNKWNTHWSHQKSAILERKLDELREENHLLQEELSSCSPARVREQLAQTEKLGQEYTELIQELSSLRQHYQKLIQELSSLRQDYQRLTQEALQTRNHIENQSGRSRKRGLSAIGKNREVPNVQNII
ncbi:MAG: hypothetical protein HFH41_00455 [Lachnospiraceae bacterium]|nr:hypothetical protein [Lachnospiraceae bacterium]